MSKYYECFNSKLEAFLSEKNKATDSLDKIEKATGVKKLYIAQGMTCPSKSIIILYMISLVFTVDIYFLYFLH